MTGPATAGKPLSGVKVLLEGPSGTGKTYALGELVDWCAGQSMDVRVLFTERGLETLLGYWTERNKPVPPNLYWRDLITNPVNLSGLMDASKKVAMLNYESITKLSDPTRAGNNAFEKVLEVCNKFVCDRTGKEFGPVDGWGPNTVFVIDGLSELSNAAMKMVIGNKPTAAPGDYGIAQNMLMNFLRISTQGCACHFVLIAHVSREKDEITGGIKLMTRAIGGAISGDIPPLFSDVIYCVREGATFFWDTANMQADLKTRNLPISGKIPPQFSQIMNKWLARSNSIAAGGQSAPTIKQ